jgi:uncharacterized delta-60 repeat protein
MSATRVVAVGVLAVSLALAGAHPALAAAGDLDPSFDGDGKVTTSMGADAAGASVAIQADDRIVVAGQATVGGRSRFALTRYVTIGTLDPTFGGDGKVSTVVGTNASAEAVAIQSDGKIVAAGGADPHGFALVRYGSDGTLDDTFGGDGKVTTVIGDADAAHANAVVLQSDGKIVAAGQTQVGGEDRFALARYNTDGTLDDTFGEDGRVTTSFGPIADAYGVAIQSNDKIVAAGRALVGAHYRFALARYRSDGTRDDTFGGDGTVTTLIGPVASLGHAVAIQSNGKIVVGGSKQNGMALAVARYDSDGTLDDTFSDDGVATTPVGSTPQTNAMAIQGDGKIVLAGYARFDNRPRFVLARFDTGGTLDETFSGNGKTTTKIGVGSLARGVALQSDGRIVAAGYVASSHERIAVARYLGA